MSFYDAHDHHPADPELANALRRQIAAAHEETKSVHAVMCDVAASCPDYIGGERFYDAAGKLMEYIKPDQVLEINDAVVECSEQLAKVLEKAATLEEQERLILLGMRQAMETVSWNAANPQAVYNYLATLEGMFSEYHERGLNKSRALLDMENNVKYYAGMCYGSLACMDSLLEHVQREQIEAQGRYVATPYQLAFLRDRQTRPLEVSEGTRYEHCEKLQQHAASIFVDLLKPYEDSIPHFVSPDILGYIFRCTQQVADRVYAQDRPKRAPLMRGSNDNAPEAMSILLEDPKVRVRVRSILSTLFTMHPDAMNTPQSAMEAATTLEQLLIKDAQRQTSDRGRA